MTNGQTIEIGPFNFTVLRSLIVIGLIRVIVKGERIHGGLTWVDRFMIFWAAAAVASSPFHKEVTSALVFRCGFALNGLGAYWLMRTFIRSLKDFLLVARLLLLLLTPLAAEMMVEKVTGRNFFALLGSSWEYPEVRNGRVRAQGPFAHSILAGTAGAACVPLALLFWRRNRKLALIGTMASGGIVFASASSGPIMTMMATLGALIMWKFRKYMRAVRWGLALGTLGLALVMNAPVYYLISYIDLAGGSTGWHRAALMDAGFNQLHEWWFAGTDYTRHWMPTGIPANENHTDITNVYLMMGVIGGMPLMLMFVAALTSAFVAVGQALRRMKGFPAADKFVLWSLGAILFGHAVTFVSVDYFDQTIVLYYLVLAAISSLYATFARSARRPMANTPLPQVEGAAGMAGGISV